MTDLFYLNLPENAFLRGYIICALWSSVDDNGDPLDKNFVPEDFSEDTIEKFKKDCEDFCSDPKVKKMIEGREEDAGIDFWLTRNNHGTGFWDYDIFCL
jgi:hypothetical protein